MPKTENRNASGEMELNYDWWEDSQGSKEVYNNCASLAVDSKDDTLVVMTLQDGQWNPYKGKNDTHPVEYTITNKQLIKLIREHGHRR